MAQVEVDIELRGKVVYTETIDIPDDVLGMFHDQFAGINVRAHINKEISSQIRTKWRYAEPFTDDDKALVSLLGSSGLIPKGRRAPRKK